MAKLWIPPDRDLMEGKRYRCLNCGHEFMRGHLDQYTRHVVACIRKAPEAVEAHVESKRSSVFTSIADEEQYRWVRKRAAEGKKATKGGRAA